MVIGASTREQVDLRDSSDRRLSIGTARHQVHTEPVNLNNIYIILSNMPGSPGKMMLIN